MLKDNLSGDMTQHDQGNHHQNCLEFRSFMHHRHSVSDKLKSAFGEKQREYPSSDTLENTKDCVGNS